MHQPNDRETKIYVAGLAWVTRTDYLRSYFERFGEIVYANVVCDGATGRSKGFGFVTFREAESARRACEYPNHIIDGRMASCKLAYRGANQQNQNGQPPATFYIPFWYPNWEQLCQYNVGIRIKDNFNLRQRACCYFVNSHTQLGLTCLTLC